MANARSRLEGSEQRVLGQPLSVSLLVYVFVSAAILMLGFGLVLTFLGFAGGLAPERTERSVAAGLVLMAIVMPISLVGAAAQLGCAVTVSRRRTLPRRAVVGSAWVAAVYDLGLAAGFGAALLQGGSPAAYILPLLLLVALAGVTLGVTGSEAYRARR